MVRRRQTVLPFDPEHTDEPLVDRAGLVLVYETARTLGLPQAIDRELPEPGSGRGYRPPQYVLPLLVIFHGGGRKLDDLRELEAEPDLWALMEIGGLPQLFDPSPLSCHCHQPRRGPQADHTPPQPAGENGELL